MSVHARLRDLKGARHLYDVKMGLLVLLKYCFNVSQIIVVQKLFVLFGA